MRKLLPLFLFMVSLLAVVGCNAFGGDDDNDYTGPVAVNAPANAKAFDGVKLSFNPTITFASDGTTNTFTYINNDGDTGNSIFPDAVTAPLSGTYTYTQSASVKTEGTLDFSFTDDATKNFSLTMKNFSGYASGITGLEITKVDDASSMAYSVQILSGQLAPDTANNTGTPTATDTNTSTGTETSTGGTDTTTPDVLKGKAMTLLFASSKWSSPSPLPDGFPYKEGDVMKFTFNSDNVLAIGKDGAQSRDLGTPQKYAGSGEIVWFDSEYNIFYALSLVDDLFNEINAYSDPAKKPVAFYGQFKEAK